MPERPAIELLRADGGVETTSYGALEDLARASELRPEDPSVKVLRASVLLHLGRPEEARDALYAKRDQLIEEQLRAKFQYGRLGSGEVA